MKPKAILYDLQNEVENPCKYCQNSLNDDMPQEWDEPCSICKHSGVMECFYDHSEFQPIGVGVSERSVSRMTIEQAITYFEDAVRETDEIIADCSLKLQKELLKQKKHFVIALTALQEKQERDKGCGLCADEADHNYPYCRWCGRKLGENNG
jgi:hypothetical protein